MHAPVSANRFAGRQGGVALVLVLWAVVLLTIIAVSQVSTQRTELSMTLNVRQAYAGRALVDAGTNFMLWQLLQPGQEQDGEEWLADGLARPWVFAGREILLRAEPETARIDLNSAEPELLLGLLQSAGLQEQEATMVKDAILDWRDADSNHQLNGAEDDDYRSAGLLYGAADARFQTVSELRRVLGVSSSLYDRVAPALTVYSGQRTLDPVVASRAALLAVPGLTPERVDAYLATRLQKLEQGLPVDLPVGVTADVLSQSNPSVYRIHAETELPGGGRMAGQLVVDLDAEGGSSGYRILERSYPVSRAGEQPAMAQDQDQVQ